MRMNLKKTIFVLLSILFTITGYVSRFSMPVVVNSNMKKKETPSKLERIKRNKKIEKKLAIMTAFGSSIPALDNIFSISKYINEIKTNIKNILNIDTIDEINKGYKYTIKHMVENNSWDYSVLYSKIEAREVLWLSISQDGKYVIAISVSVVFKLLHITSMPLFLFPV